MINLDIKSKQFNGNEKWPLLYVIAEIYHKLSNEFNPLLDGDVVDIAKQDYNLIIERHLIKRYRDYLSQYFGYSFEKRKKGYFLLNDISLANAVVKKNYPINDIINYDSVDINDSLSKKISIILSAIRREKQIKITIDNCIYFVSDYIQKKKHKDPVVVGEGQLIITPLKIFIHSRKVYLLSFNDSDSTFYISLLDTITVRKDSITRVQAKKISFDLNSYISNQDFIVTGPVDENYHFKYSFKILPESYGFNNMEVFYWKKKKKTPVFKYFLQSLIDLYGAEEISTRFPKIERFVKGIPEYDMVDSFAISFPCDTRAESFLKRYSTDEIYFDDFYFDDLHYDYD